MPLLQVLLDVALLFAELGSSEQLPSLDHSCTQTVSAVSCFEPF